MTDQWEGGQQIAGKIDHSEKTEIGSDLTPLSEMNKWIKVSTMKGSI